MDFASNRIKQNLDWLPLLLVMVIAFYVDVCGGRGQRRKRQFITMKWYRGNVIYEVYFWQQFFLSEYGRMLQPNNRMPYRPRWLLLNVEFTKTSIWLFPLPRDGHLECWYLVLSAITTDTGFITQINWSDLVNDCLEHHSPKIKYLRSKSYLIMLRNIWLLLLFFEWFFLLWITRLWNAPEKLHESSNYCLIWL